MKPIIKYRGGKTKELDKILPHVPENYDRYIEPFFGGGALYFHLEPQHAIINDINHRLMEFYRGFRDNFDQLQTELQTVSDIYTLNRAAFDAAKRLHPEDHVPDANEDLYYHIRDMFNGVIPLEYTYALVYLFINKTAYAGMTRFNAQGLYNVPFGRYKNFAINNVTQNHRDLLARTEIMEGDFQNVFNIAGPNDFIFLDPPYDCIFNDYGNVEYLEGGFGEEEHRRLAQAIREVNSRVLMVIGETPLTRELYDDLVVENYEKDYAVNIRNRFHAGATHLVIRNY